MRSSTPSTSSTIRAASSPTTTTSARSRGASPSIWRERSVRFGAEGDMPWRTRIVGRSPETAQLDGQWQRAASGEFRFVLVVGEPGMGKTRLAAESLEDRRRASIELSARAHPLGDTASFGLWVEALERHLRNLGKQEVALLCGGFLDDLASLLRSVAVVR
ncbi:MAG TPA: ATP-binding protein, partial [Acidimicrobiia bacterium]|nr:ATP-binding protein [Acidimicrobiia bacterium]